MHVWMYTVPANVQRILDWFGINLQGISDPFLMINILILSLLIISLITFASNTVKLRRPLSKVAYYHYLIDLI